jgi:hypothetical protein
MTVIICIERTARRGFGRVRTMMGIRVVKMMIDRRNSLATSALRSPEPYTDVSRKAARVGPRPDAGAGQLPARMGRRKANA